MKYFYQYLHYDLFHIKINLTVPWINQDFKRLFHHVKILIRINHSFFDHQALNIRFSFE